MKFWKPWVVMAVAGCLGLGCSSEPGSTAGQAGELQRKAEKGTATLADWQLAKEADRDIYTQTFTLKRFGTADEKRVKDLTDYINSFISRMTDPRQPTVPEAVLKSDLNQIAKSGARLMGWPPEQASAAPNNPQ